MDDLPPISFVCWSCQGVVPTADAVELRREPRLWLPCCVGCWNTMTAAERLAAAQAFYDSQKRQGHRERLENAAGQAAHVIDRWIELIGEHLGDQL